jgi:hypothetical protein
MNKNNLNIFKYFFILLLSGFLLSACGKKTTTPKINPTPIEQKLELKESEKPIISLIPRADGHELKLIIDNIPTNISDIEYELIYSAIDNGLEMEKGVGDSIKVTTKNIERDLLLGTSSCTNGCKYKYDSGVVGGTLSLTFLTASNQSLRYESSFVLKTSADIKKDGGLTLNLENFEIKGSVTSKNDYFILLKNLPSYYSVFSNGTGKGSITKITPDTVTKEDKTSLVGNYLIN